MSLSEETLAKLRAGSNAAKKGITAAAKAAPKKVSAADIKASLKPKAAKVLTPEEQARADEKAKMNAEGAGLSGLTKDWAVKFKKMNNPENWFLICMTNQAQVEKFIAGWGIEDTLLDYVHYEDYKFFDGPKVAEILGVDLEADYTKPKVRKVEKVSAADMKRRLQYQAHPDPFVDIDYDYGTLEDSIRFELEALRRAFDAGLDPQWAEKHADAALDSPYWFGVVFPDMDVKVKFVHALELSDIGDKYLDGPKVAERLGIDIGSG